MNDSSSSLSIFSRAKSTAAIEKGKVNTNPGRDVTEITYINNLIVHSHYHLTTQIISRQNTVAVDKGKVNLDLDRDVTEITLDGDKITNCLAV